MPKRASWRGSPPGRAGTDEALPETHQPDKAVGKVG